MWETKDYIALVHNTPKALWGTGPDDWPARAAQPAVMLRIRRFLRVAEAYRGGKLDYPALTGNAAQDYIAAQPTLAMKKVSRTIDPAV